MKQTLASPRSARWRSCRHRGRRRPAAASKDVDAALQAFWTRSRPQDAEKLVRDIVASGVTFDEAMKRLKMGGRMRRTSPKGVVKDELPGPRNREFFYSVNVPTPTIRRRRIRSAFQLHGGVSRPSNQPRGNGRHRRARRRANRSTSCRTGGRTRSGGRPSSSTTCARSSTRSSAPTTSTKIASCCPACPTAAPAPTTSRCTTRRRLPASCR